VVETSWEALGHVIATGSSLPLAGEPRLIAGYGRERYVYAPIGGTFRTAFHIGDRVKAGEVLAQIGATALAAPLGAKVIEVNPRDQAITRGIGERPGRIADGVARAIQMWEGARQPRH
jgi:xanthine dehydrogenase accessory factor